MSQIKKNIMLFREGCLNSYSQVFFSESKIFAFILCFVSFLDLWAGLAGLISVFVANGVGLSLGYNTVTLRKGLYGFNSLLVGLGIGLYFQSGMETFILVILTSLLTFFFVIFIEGILLRYGLPFLSLPFTLAIWIVMMASSDLDSLGLSERSIYSANRIFSLGGVFLVKIHDWINRLAMTSSIGVYLNSLGAIFFQHNLLGGTLIAIGLLYYSRIAFCLSLLGFYVAFYFYSLVGADINTLSYTYIGFNFILTAVAVGGYFFIPSLGSYLSVVFLLPIVVLITLSSINLLGPYHLSVYALPFNVATLLFLFVLKQRYNPGRWIREVLVQHNSPEKNLYFYENSLNRFGGSVNNHILLPFNGMWTVSQAHNGELTHLNDWRHAWDFIIEDEQRKQYKNHGLQLSDYYCYNKSVLAPANGEVVNICDYVPDNRIGEVNLEQNWGNSLVIRHSGGLYSQMSHLKPGSIKVAKGEMVNQGTPLARCGNSGRSPYPHLHFQLQTTPHIGSLTLDMPLNNFLVKESDLYFLKCFERPLLHQTLLRGQSHPLLINALKLIPGKRLKFDLIGDVRQMLGTDRRSWSFNVKVDYHNYTYLFCPVTDSYAYFRLEENLLSFTNFVGERKSLLYYLYLSLYKVYLGFYPSLVIEDQLPANQIFSYKALFLQDFLAPFYLYLRVGYCLKYIKNEDSLSKEYLTLESKVTKSIGQDTSTLYVFRMCFSNHGLKEWIICNKKSRLEVKCLNES